MAFAQDGDPVAEPFGFGQPVCVHQDGGAIGDQLADELLHGSGGGGVEAARRFVEEKDARPVDDRAGEPDALFEAFGELADAIPAALGHAGEIQRLRDRGFDRRDAVCLSPEAEVVINRLAVVEAGLFGHDPDGVAHLHRFERRVPRVHPHGPGGGLQQGRHDPQRGRLPGAIRSEEPDDLAALDGEAPGVEALCGRQRHG